MNKVVARSALIEAMNLSAVMGFEEINEVVEEVMDFDDGLIGDRRQANLHRVGIRSHNSDYREAARRVVGISGGAKTSR